MVLTVWVKVKHKRRKEFAFQIWDERKLYFRIQCCVITHINLHKTQCISINDLSILTINNLFVWINLLFFFICRNPVGYNFPTCLSIDDNNYLVMYSCTETEFFCAGKEIRYILGFMKNTLITSYFHLINPFRVYPLF